jgi:hypothetical protein
MSLPVTKLVPKGQVIPTIFAELKNSLSPNVMQTQINHFAKNTFTATIKETESQRLF